MARGLYLVRTDRWYTERATWGLSGLVVLAATALAALVDPRFVGLVAVTGAFSVAVALTGYCAMSTALLQLGMPSRLTPSHPRPTLFGRPVYRARTDSWYLERGIYLIVGVNLTIASVLTLVHSPWWLLFTGFVGGASLLFAASGFCPVANALYQLGFEPRLGPVARPRNVAAGR
ncbi:MAG: DUF2892 domain-containing protein [Myxococcota bacterium]